MKNHDPARKPNTHSPSQEVAMAKKKDIRALVRLKSTVSSFTYITQKNRRNTTLRLVLKKYDPTIRRHVEFREAK